MTKNFSVPLEKSYVSLVNKRDATLTMPWFSEFSKYKPSAANVVEPLINGERTFQAVYKAIEGAKKSIEIASWGFDPSMRFIRPGGLRIGELLQQKAKEGVSVRVLVWKNALANFIENNIIGDGLFGSGGGSGGVGSGVGSTGAGDASGGKDGANGYGGKVSGSAGVRHGDPDAKKFNRDWFAANTKGLSFRTRDFSSQEKDDILERHYYKYGIKGDLQRTIFTYAPTHHQKMVLVDYEVAADATGFVMGHNMLRDYWDTDSHDFATAARDGFQPWQDVSTRVHGPVLCDLNENFCTGWTKAQPWRGSDQPINASRMAIKPEVFEEAAKKYGTPEPAQIIRTQPQENERSILDAYKIALTNARNYVYFENQYFRSKEIALYLRQVRKQLKQGGWTRDFYVFIVTNKPDDFGRVTTYEALSALGKGKNLPTIDKKETNDGKNDKDAALRKVELDGINIHVCTLESCGSQPVYRYDFPADNSLKTNPLDLSYKTSTAPVVPVMKSTQVGTEYLYQDIYVHSKLMLVDDIFFTVGSANVNARSFEVDSELNIAMPSPKVTTQWRQHLWKLHTGRAPLDVAGDEYIEWGKIMAKNKQAKDRKLPLPTGTLIEFYDDSTSGKRGD
jgi:phosphatidylserine/phosphatidylglycerophosphate/cardiolipin synthase-like enzyme